MTGPADVVRENPRHVVLLALVAGVALCQLDTTALALCVVLLIVLLAAATLPVRTVLTAALLLALGAALGDARLGAIDADPLAAQPDRAVTLSGHAVELPRTHENGWSLRLRVVLPGGSRQLVELRSQRSSPGDLRIGDELVVEGRLRTVDPAAARGPAGASYARYLLRSGVRRQLSASEVRPTGWRRGGAVGVVDGVRVRAENALARGLPPEPAGLLRGMVLGGDAGLTPATSEDFRVVGLSHILAVSGQNVLLIVILVRALLNALAVPHRFRQLIPAVVIVIYMLLCGSQASVIRAGAMGLAALSALAASRPSSRVWALLLGALVVLLLNPRSTGDVGAQLSFAAVLGIMAFTRPLLELMGGLPRWVAEAFAVTAGATIATAPLMAHHFRVVSVVSLIVNVLAEPLIGPIVWLGSLTAALGQLSVPLAALLNLPNALLLGSLISLAEVAATLPGAQVEAAGFGISALVIGAGVVTLLALLANGLLPLPAVPQTRMRALGCLGALLLAWWLLRPPAELRGPVIAMLDVGQGDATLVVGGSGCKLLIDGGPPGAGLPRELRRLGVRRLDAMVATHAEDDHFGGLLELAEAGRVSVGTLLDGGGPEVGTTYTRFRQLLAEAGTQLVAAETGVVWRCGDLAVHLLGPDPLPPGAAPPADANDRAAVTLVTAGPLSMFASGDAESPMLTDLTIPPAAVLKVPHHGSADPGLPQLLERIRPEVALIGVGAANTYGHPTAQVLDDLAAAGVRVARTDRDGAVVLRARADGRLELAAGGGR